MQHYKQKVTVMKYGRVLLAFRLPTILSTSYNFTTGDRFELFTDTDRNLYLSKITEKCVFCGCHKATELCGKPVCHKCYKKLKQIKRSKEVEKH